MRRPRQWVEACNDAILLNPWILPVLVILVYGFGHIDFSDFKVLTRDPFVTMPDPERQFLHSSPLIFFLGWPLTHAFGVNASYLLVTSFGFVLLASVLLIHVRQIDQARRTVACFVLLSSPLFFVLLHWMGKSDTYLVAFYLALVTFRDRFWLTVLLSALMIVTHREVGTLMLVGDQILWRRALKPIAIGLFLGHGLVFGYHAALEPKPAGRGDFVLRLLHGRGLWRDNPIAHLLLGPGWFWMFLVRFSGGQDAWRVAFALVLCFAAAATTIDYTRDFILCAVPLIVYVADRIATHPDPVQATVRWPALFAIQVQIDNANQLHDSSWFR